MVDLAPIEARVRADDGTDLAVHALGDGPLVVLANGLGGSLPAWGPLLRDLVLRHRVVSWDYRGLYRSGPPPGPDAVTISDHARDLEAVLAWAGGGPAVLTGWSMGVQVVVEHALAHPEEVRALVLVAGSPGDPLATVLHTRASRCVVPPLTRLVELGAAPFGAGLRAATAPSWAPAALQRLGILAPTADLEVFGALAHDFARLDWRLYMRTIRAMARHDAWPRLGELAVPTLVVGGTRDLFLPARTVEAMAVAIPEAELWLVEGGTHYLPVEFPAALDARIDRFVAERVASSMGS